jgi:hypothetical protein
MSTNQEDRAIKAGRMSTQANKTFLDTSRELLVSFSRDDLQKALLSYIRLHFGSEIQNAEPNVDFYVQIQQRAFLELYDRDVINPVYPITALGEKAIQEMRRATGIGLQKLPTPPPPEPSAMQKLEAEILHDWRTLSGDTVRKKAAGNRIYRETLNRLLSSDAIDANVKLLQAGE